MPIPMQPKKLLIATALGLGAAGSLACALTFSTSPAHAQLTVFDPTNYSQNLLTAARRSPRSTTRSSRCRTRRKA